MSSRSLVVAVVFSLGLGILGILLWLNPEWIRGVTLDANRPIRNWPVVGRIAYDFVQTPGYVVQVRFVAALMLLMAVILVSLVVRSLLAR